MSKLTVLLNPVSGAKREQDFIKQLIEMFQAVGRDIVVTELSSVEQIPRLVDAALERDDTIVAAGGDGTISAVAAALIGGSTRLGVLPLGTLNHFARDLGIPIDLPKAVQTIAHGRVVRVDAGRVNDRIFINNSSIGVYPSIIERREDLRRHGYAKLPALVMATLEILRRDYDVSVRLEANGRHIVSRTPFVFIGNNEYLAEGIHLGARTKLDGGRLFAYFAPPVRTRDLPRLLAQSLAGRARRQHTLESISAVELWLETPHARRIRVACDGELITMTTPLHFRTLPMALNVLVPAAAASTADPNATASRRL
jgi:YegS/Rv2252/BmrU family lipid kinase